MAIRLIFDKGVFVPLPGAGERRTIAVHMASSPRVVIEPNGFDDLQKELYLARNVHFVSDEKLDATNLKLRSLINHLAVDYSRFEKVVTFTGGLVEADFRPLVPPNENEVEDMIKIHMEAHETEDPELQLQAYKRFHKIGHDMFDDDYREGIAKAFADTDDAHLWIPGWTVTVTLKNSAPVRVDGRYLDLSDGTTLKFIGAKGSEIPHFHRGVGAFNNPHVLEQPPTNCGD
jgi:hypothetical protein